MTRKYIIEVEETDDLSWLRDDLAILNVEEIVEKKYRMNTCCPDKGLAVEEGFFVMKGRLPYIKLGSGFWDMDHCPFCGVQIMIVQEEV